MRIDPIRAASWTTTSVAFVVGLLLLGPILFVASFAMPTARVGMLAYNAAFSVFPAICLTGTPFGECSRVGGVPAYWSWFVWLPIAAVFGYFMRTASLQRRILAWALTVITIIALLQGIMRAAGWQQFIDAV